MTTLQEQFEKDFPDKSVGYLQAYGKYWNKSFTNYDLDLSEYVNLEELDLRGNENITSIKLSQSAKLTSLKLENNKLTQIDLSQQRELVWLDLNINQLTQIDLSQQRELRVLWLYNNSLTSVEFLNSLPNPEKLETLRVDRNDIEPTDISFFSKFVNLRGLVIGNEGKKENKHNKFYGSFKSWKNLTKLTHIFIEATDIDEGLEYLPNSLLGSKAEKTWENWEYFRIHCSLYKTDAKCKVIRNELRPYDYDVEAWQLIHPEKMLISRPELFTNEDSKDEWIQALKQKISQTETKQIELPLFVKNKTKRIKIIERLKFKTEKLKEVFTSSLEKPERIDEIKIRKNKLQELELSEQTSKLTISSNKEETELDKALALYERTCERHEKRNNEPHGYLNCKSDACAYGIGDPCPKHKYNVERQRNNEKTLLERVQSLQDYTSQIQIPPKK